MTIYRKINCFTRVITIMGLLFTLTSCQNIPQSNQLTGLVFERKPLASAQIQLTDSAAKQLQTRSDAMGRYAFPLEGVKAPLMLTVVAEGDAENCKINSSLRPICMAAIVETLDAKKPTGNINPLTDSIASDVAVAQGFIGPQQWADAKGITALNASYLHRAQDALRKGFSQALKSAGVNNVGRFDPALYPMQGDYRLTRILGLIHHNRNYDNNSGETGHVALTDSGFRPIVGLTPNSVYESFDLARAETDAQRIKQAERRIFIVGDSTSAVYEQSRFPRMGWGQVFAGRLKPDANVAVVVGSRAGRSSRDFYNGRWFAQMEPLIQPGDYVFINHGHNDQNCNSRRPERGTADVENLCTYPNNSEGQPQFPDGQPERSFQHSLERYITIARERGARPVLFTPTARIKNADGQQATPVVPSHVTTQNADTDYRYVGDYAQTIKDTATANAVAIIDLEAASRQFANNLGGDSWKNYWLAVDPAINRFYAGGVPGSLQTPDGTHFQKRGAEAIAELVSTEIKGNRELKELARYLQ